MIPILLYVNSSAMILYTMYSRSISEVEVSQSPAAATPRAACRVSKERTISLERYENAVTNPIHYKKPPRRKTEKVATPRGGENASFPANLQRGFLIFSGDGSTRTAGRIGGRPMGWQGQLSWRYWRILMMLQRTTTTTRRAAMAGWEEGLSPSMPSWEHHPLSPPLMASC